MWMFSGRSSWAAGVLFLLAATPLAAAGLSRPPSGMAGLDFGQDKKFKARTNGESLELREAVDETQVLLDGLARESVRQDSAVVKELLRSLRLEYGLPEAEDRARKALEIGEEIVRLQAGQEQLKEERDRSTDLAERERLRTKLLGVESDLMGQVEELRKVLRSLHKDLKGAKSRELRNWMMVSEGLLRRRREAAEEAAQREAAAQALSDTAVTAPPPNAEQSPEPAAESKPVSAGQGPKPRRTGRP